MSRRTEVEHQFVDIVPDTLHDGVVYVCIRYTTAVHRCLCGCGEEVVTPIKPTGWRLTFDGVTVSLHPSIGNWDFTCRSHYWITNNRVYWDQQWTWDDVCKARQREDAHRAEYFTAAALQPQATTASAPKRWPTPLRRMARWLRKWRRRSGHDQTSQS